MSVCRCFSGLESKIVLLAGLDDIPASVRENACYAGASRAQNILHIIANPITVKALKKGNVSCFEL